MQLRILLLALFCLPIVPIRAQETGPSVDVPEWAKEAVWYQIFPERFRNGDPANDPTLEDIRGSWPHIQPDNWRIASWTADWYEQADWEKDTSDEFYVTVQLRRYGGDLQGIIDRLDYLDSLGVTAIYLNPIFESPSLHKYDGSFFHHVDNNFGPDPDGDRARWQREDPLDPTTWTWTTADRQFLDLIEKIHARGKRIIVDGVFNHMGLRSFAFEDVVQNQQESRFRDWFTITSWDDPATPNTNEFAYEGWMGVAELPELREDENGLIEPIRDYVYSSVRRWMDPNGDGDPSDGIDGWRLDVAEMVSIRFWEAFRDSVRSINPEAYLIGEVWWEDWPNQKMYNARPWLEGNAFDAVMNYRWAVATRKLFLGADLRAGEAYGPSDFRREVTGLLGDYPPEINYGLMNTLGTHDTDRLASQVANPETFFDHGIGVRDNPDYRVRKPDAEERALQRLMLAHQFTFVGAPHLFYGDEAGMWGADDPDERKPMVWDDLVYKDEAAHPLGLDRPRDRVAVDRDLFGYYRSLTSLRQGHEALQRGSLAFLLADDERGLLAYERRFGTEIVWVAFNLGEESADVRLDMETTLAPAGHTPAVQLAGRTVYDPINGVTATLGEGMLQFDMPAGSVRVWVLR